MTTAEALPRPAEHDHESDDDENLDDELEALFDDDDNDETSEQHGQSHPKQTDKNSVVPTFKATNSITSSEYAIDQLSGNPVGKTAGQADGKGDGTAAGTAAGQPQPPQPRTFLDALVAKRGSAQLTGHIATIAADAAALMTLSNEVNQSNQSNLQGSIPPTTDPGTSRAQRVLSRTLCKKRKAPLENETLPPKEQTKKMRDAFRVLGTTNPTQPNTTFEVNERNITNMALRYAPMDALRLTALFEHSLRVDISQLTTRFDDIRAGRITEWVMFGCLVTKHAKKEAKNGSKYAVWSLCNMPRWPISNEVPTSTNVTILLFEEAFKAFHTLGEGSVLAIRKPNLLPPRESEYGRPSERGGVEWSGLCVRVSHREQVVAIGTCKDYQRCDVPNGDLGECGRWYDGNRMQMCVMHLQRKRRKMVTGTRMDINNAERPMGSGEAKRNTVDGGIDISRWGSGAPALAQFRPDDEDRKRRQLADKAKLAVLQKKREVALSRSLREQRKGLRQDSVRALSRTTAPTRGMMMMKATREERDAKHNKGKDTAQINSSDGFNTGKDGRKEQHLQRRHKCDSDNQKNVRKAQAHYDKAVEVLLTLGFTLSKNGDLIAPTLSRHGLRLQRDVLCEQELANGEDDNDDLCLSDESH